LWNRRITLLRRSRACVAAAIAAGTATDSSTCSLFGVKGQGCVAVFTHGKADKDKDDK
jgi:hypothetical protein